MNSSPPASRELADQLKETARGLGFTLVGITAAARPETFEALREWLRQGYHGTMEYISRRESAYEHPEGVLSGVKSVILVGLPYGSGRGENRGSAGHIAAYAQGGCDYHDVLRKRLRKLSDHLHQASPGCRTRCVVDTAPLLERDFARKAGLGWFGKNTMLINKHIGSEFFLGAVLTDVELPSDTPHDSSHCGTCTRCLEACPTDAFPAPHVLDASRCISYLTIELRNASIPRTLRSGVGDWLFGCDVCQEVCPWNRKSEPSTDPAFQPDPGNDIPLREWLTMSEPEFQSRFGNTPLSRPGRAGMARNASLVLGNRGSAADFDDLLVGLDDPAPVVREAVIWSLWQMDPDRARPVLETLRSSESDATVLREIDLCLNE